MYRLWKDEVTDMTWDHFSWDEVVQKTVNTMKPLKIGLHSKNDPKVVLLVNSIARCPAVSSVPSRTRRLAHGPAAGPQVIQKMKQSWMRLDAVLIAHGLSLYRTRVED